MQGGNGDDAVYGEQGQDRTDLDHTSGGDAAYGGDGDDDDCYLNENDQYSNVFLIIRSVDLSR